MPTVSRTFTVTPTPQIVLEYLKDFSHTEQWDPGTVRCTRNEAGPIEVGATWHNVSKVAGVETELTYTLRELGPDRLVFVGENDTATSTDSITVVAAGTGSELTYEADIEMQGLSRFLAPAVKVVFEKVAHDTEKQMTEVLNQLAADKIPGA
jgi:carbon monoxide dehydrogenase subunit G